MTIVWCDHFIEQDNKIFGVGTFMEKASCVVVVGE
jgi:hypothetical protein